MEKRDIVHQIRYSSNVERMVATFNRRLANTLKVIQLALSSAVAVKLGTELTITEGVTWFGVILAAVTVLQTVFKPEEKAGIAQSQQKLYERLLLHVQRDIVTLEQAVIQLGDLGANDSSPSGAIQMAAEDRAWLQNGTPPHEPAKLGFLGTIQCWLAGDAARA